jgi:putative copper resistance protein D
VNEPLVIARAVHLAATLLLTGGLAFRCFVAPVFETPFEAKFQTEAAAGAALAARLRVHVGWTIWAALAVALVSGAAWLVLLAAEIGGVPVAEALFSALPWTVLTQTTFGATWMVRLEIAAALAVLLPARRFAPLVIDLVCTLLAAAFAAGIAWTGHAAGMEGADGAIHLSSDALHLVAAGAWLGALWPLAAVLAAAGRAGDPASATLAHEATQRFSILGMISVAVILVTGVINTWEILGTAGLFADTAYNRLLLVKVILFAAMVAFAAYNRQRLTPLLAAGDAGVMRELRWNSLSEAVLGLAILAIVAVLGRMTPHMQG